MAAAQWMLALVVVAAAVASVRAQGEECLANPTVAGCESYTVHEAVLQRDLSRLCASAALGSRTWAGWPSACTLFHECQTGGGAGPACSPMRLMQTACREAMLTPGTPSEVCTSYVMLCAPQSVVKQCKDQPALDSLLPAMQLFTAAQKLCASARAPAAAPAGDRVGVAAQDVPPASAAAGAGSACSQCSSQSFDPNQVTVQAVQGNCPDPLGTLSALCLASSQSAQGEGCAAWREFCASKDGSSFPGLCAGAAAPSPATAGKVAAPSPAPGDAGVPAPAPAAAQKVPDAGAATPAGTAEAAEAGPQCYADPAQEACRTFQHSDADSEADIRQLCGPNPFLVGCSLWDQCRSGAGTGSYCQPFSVLGTLCLPNPALAGCQRWAALCGTAGSVVQQCITAAPLRNTVLTSQTLDAVTKGCSSQTGAGVSGCQQCAAGLADCRDPLAVMSRLCSSSASSASLPQCAMLAAMCAEAGATFPSLCSGSAAAAASGAGAAAEAEPAVPAEAKMYLHASMSAMILFQSWVPTSGGAYVASCLAIMALAVAVQALKACNLRLEARWAANRAAAAAAGHAAAGALGCGSPAFARSSMDGKVDRRSSHVQAPMLSRSSLGRLVPSAGSPRHQQRQARQPYVTRQELARNAARSAFTGAVVWLDYMLMLTVMTFNLGLIISATLGFMLGALAFGHWGERAAAASGPQVPAPAAGSLQPSGESDLEVHYVAAACQAQQQQLPPPPLLVGVHSAPLPL
ncbi:hypothetical protein ABPG75_010764 [Micractinium tetrahymenae]